MSQETLEKNLRESAITFVALDKEVRARRHAITEIENEINTLRLTQDEHRRRLQTTVGKNIRMRIWCVAEFSVIVIWSDEYNTASVEAVITEP